MEWREFADVMRREARDIEGFAVALDNGKLRAWANDLNGTPVPDRSSSTRLTRNLAHN